MLLVQLTVTEVITRLHPRLLKLANNNATFAGAFRLAQTVQIR